MRDGATTGPRGEQKRPSADRPAQERPSAKRTPLAVSGWPGYLRNYSPNEQSRRYRGAIRGVEWFGAKMQFPPLPPNLSARIPANFGLSPQEAPRAIGLALQMAD